MKRDLLDRPGASNALPWLAGASWLAAGLASLVRENPTHALDAWMLVPLTLTYLALAKLASGQWSRLPRYGQAGCWILLAGAPPVAVGQLAAAFDWDGLKWLGFPVGILAFTIGSALFGVALARSAFEPIWTGYAIAVAQPAAMLTGVALSPIRELSDYGSYTGAIAHGILWLAIAWGLSRDPASQPGHPGSIPRGETTHPDRRGRRLPMSY